MICKKQALFRLALATLGTTLVSSIATRTAWATPDAPNFDGRATAMSGGGITFSPGSSGLGANPALLRYT